LDVQTTGGEEVWPSDFRAFDSRSGRQIEYQLFRLRLRRGVRARYVGLQVKLFDTTL